VVEPNVLGMGTYAAGPLMTTKPYVSGAAYLAKMSDYCQSCAFDPKTTCPVTRLYWAFLARHEARLPGPRMAMPLVSVRKRSAAERAADAEEFHRVSRALTEGERLTPR
jgi:deoxyribodipyrimidine photolyase-related protein